jgi:hypothetical protein
MALTVGVRAVRLERCTRHLGWHAAGGFEEAGKPDAAQQACGLRLSATLAKTLEIGERDRIVQIGGEAAAVDRHAHRRAVWKPADDVAAAQLDRIDPGQALARTNDFVCNSQASFAQIRFANS